MDEHQFLADRFEAHRAQLRSVAYRMLGSLSEADDAVQEAWIRMSRADTAEVANLGAWLTTVVGRVCLDMLRSRRSRREEPWHARMPDPIVAPADEAAADPEHQAVLADSVGLALLVVLETLGPAERLAFVLHDMFAMPFEEIAPIVGRSPAAARKLASRARQRVRGTAPAPDADLARQREAVNAFLAAARSGDFDALVAVLDPDVVLRADVGAGLRTETRVPHTVEAGLTTVRGADAVAGNALAFHRFSSTYTALPAIVNGTAGVVSVEAGRPLAVLAFTIVGGRIAEIDILADPDRLGDLDLAVLDD